eukprot:TRINITY_DN2587_c0_g1_i1.p1 TRINITY_DN2587_c0_g1~~TRINITY_DN2587_c0_g1_i1.p1  ORF type:complete len:290 (+),score=26.08 TRINITY_DN2587_c0_g1_i1:533-1402(+)
MSYNGVSFGWTKIFFFTTSCLYTLVSVWCAAIMPKTYYTPCVKCEWENLGEDTHLLHSTQEYEETLSVFAYIKNSVKHIWNTEQLRGALIHTIPVILAYSVLSSAGSLFMPSRGDIPNITPSRDNYCAGYLINSCYQAIFMNIMYIAASLFFYFIMRRIKPFDFYAKWYPYMGLVLGVASIVLVLPAPSVVLYLVLSVNVSGYWFMFLYSRYFAIANVDQRYYGFYGFLNQYIQTFSSLCVTFLYTVKFSENNFLYISYGAIAVSVLWSLFFGWNYRQKLEDVSQEKCY